MTNYRFIAINTGFLFRKDLSGKYHFLKPKYIILTIRHI